SPSCTRLSARRSAAPARERMRTGVTVAAALRSIGARVAVRPSGGLPDREAGLTSRLFPVNVHSVHDGARRPAPAPLDHALDVLVLALEHGHHGPVAVVADPAAHAERPRARARLVAKGAALDQAP